MLLLGRAGGGARTGHSQALNGNPRHLGDVFARKDDLAEHSLLIMGGAGRNQANILGRNIHVARARARAHTGYTLKK